MFQRILILSFIFSTIFTLPNIQNPLAHAQGIEEDQLDEETNNPSEGPSDNSDSKITRSHYDTEQGIAIIVPKSWQEADPPRENILTVFKAEPENDFAMNLNISKNKGHTDLKSVGKALKSVFAKQFDDWALGYEGFDRINGHEAYYISSKISISGFEIQNLQMLFNHPNGKDFYIVTFTCLEDDYESMKDTFLKSLKSTIIY